VGAGGAGAEVGAGAGAEVGAGVGAAVGFGAGVLLPLPPPLGAGDDCFGSAFFFFFFLGSDFIAGTGAAALAPTVTDADASSTAFVPGALDLAVPPPLSEPPLDALAMPNATAKATTTAATVIPI